MASPHGLSVFSDDPSFLRRVLGALPAGQRFDRIGWPEVEEMIGKEEATPGTRRGERRRLPSDVLVLAAASELPRLTPFLHAAHRHRRLRALLLRDDEPEWLPQLLARANVRLDAGALRGVLVTRGDDTGVPRRVLAAWALGAPGELIADARTLSGGERLLVVSCAMEQTELAFEAVPALARIPEDERPAFEIASRGSYLHWPASGVDLDLDALRHYAGGAARRRRADRERQARDEQFGAAVAAVRERHALRPADVAGLSARQVRQIEKGARYASAGALEKLADAHGLRANEYLERVARAASDAS